MMKTEYTEQSIQTIRMHKHNKNKQLTELNKSIQNTQPYTQRLKKKRTERTSLHCNTSPHFTQLHFTSSHTSLPSHLLYPNYISYRPISPHITKLDTVQFFHFQTYFHNNEPLHCPQEPLTISLNLTFFSLILSTLHFTLLVMLIISTTHFPSLVFTFLTLILKICFLPWEVPIAPSGRWFQSVMDLFTVSISQCLFFVIWFSFSNNDRTYLSSLASVTYPLLLSMASHSICFVEHMHACCLPTLCQRFPA